jgi:DMSO/TMAO reductase YedYZ heme-binding membrane subunit
VVVEPIVVVPVVPDVVVEVVPEVDVAVVEVMAVPEVSVDVPDGIAEVDVPELVVSVAIVPVVDVSVDIVDEESVEAALVSVLLLLVSLLQANPKTLSARTVTRTRSFLLIMCFFLSIICVCV